MDFNAIRLEPARPAMRVPTLLTGGSVGKRNGGGKRYSTESLMTKCIARKKENPTPGGAGGFPYSYSARLSREGGASPTYAY